MGGNNFSKLTETAAGNVTTPMEINERSERQNFLRGTRAYLSGPMGFVASRSNEKDFGWRSRVSEFLRAREVIVFDPLHKPKVRDLEGYGVENVDAIKKKWSFEQGQAGDEVRAECAALFAPTVKIDLRMIDTSDFTIACCPTNIYSAGTVHEIIRSREQSKPVLFVSPHIGFPALDRLRRHLEEKNDATGRKILEKLVEEVPIKPNPEAIPSLWYMPLLDTTTVFDGFGFGQYSKEFGWTKGSIDELEELYPPKNPLLPYLEKLTHRIPERWDDTMKKYVRNDDWLIWVLKNLQ